MPYQSMPRRQTCIVMKTCIMMSHVCHSERGFVISDCLVRNRAGITIIEQLKEINGQPVYKFKKVT